MNQTARIISIYAADTSGVCSALYEYGGMTVIHDASGCNSTYTTHDEPRWYDKKSMMFISGLTEKDAVMGNDDRFINDLIIAANELKPAFITLCASPLPAMIGTDLEAIAYAVETETGIPSFMVKTNGMQSYITGAGNALLELAKRFAGPESDTLCQLNGKIKVNLLGVTPLDFPKKENTDSLINYVNQCSFELNACVSVNTDLDEFKKLHNADVNLLVSSSGKLLADYLYEEYKIPYVKGVPYGTGFAGKIKETLIKAYETKENIDATAGLRSPGNVAILGESIMSASLASALLLDKGINANILETVGDGDFDILKSFDLSCDDEKILENVLKKYDVIIGDPLFKPICADKNFIELPHEAFSGRCFTKNAPNLINTTLDNFI
ncbi:MAG: oxidoreductase [Lachnospiraceae bacterium]|nr:oxidoreductase [Lachnospiraceae bacterium]